MSKRHVLVVGGGLAGLSAGIYALRSGYKVTIVEHNLALGGVCTAWRRGPYLIDGCIHWLTGGPFERVYEELGILPQVALRPLDTWTVYRDMSDGFEVRFSSDLDAFCEDLAARFPEDRAELARLRHGAVEMAQLTPPLDAVELGGAIETLRAAWGLRGALGSLVHFRKPIAVWAAEHLQSPRLRRVFTSVLPETAPAAVLLMVLGYLSRGWLSRPVGGTDAFRSALERTYRTAGGEVLLHATVDEILVRDRKAVGLRLADGSMLDADVVVSTSSAPETTLRLLGGRFQADALRERLATWKLFDPIVLASFGVARPYAKEPALQVIDGLPSFDVGGRTVESIAMRICNDDPCFAPAGHSVVQAMIPTSYDWWAKQGTRYASARDDVGDAALAMLGQGLPELRDSVRMADVATPLTYWNMARSWRGAYEGWQPNAASLFGHVGKKLDGLAGCYLAGQWVEPGGGVPTAVTSGRQVVQLLCEDDGRAFVAAG